MRILASLDTNALALGSEANVAVSRERKLAQMANALVALAEEHELAITHALDMQLTRAFELALRNELPDRNLATVFADVVVDRRDPATDRAMASEPQAIVELPSLRALLDAGVLPICAFGGGGRLVIDSGVMRRVEGAVDANLTAALLARRLDADLFLILTEEEAAPIFEAARSFADATGCRSAVGDFANAAEIVCGQAGAQISRDG